jgi:hypothetical protein
VPLALATVALAHATQPLIAITAQTVTGCNFDTVSGTSLNGSVTSGGMGLTLSGAATVRGASNCSLDFNWQGTGRGNFLGSNGTVGASFTFARVSAVFVPSWTLVATFNGVPQTLASCNSGSGAACTAPVSFSNLAATLPTGLPNSWTWSVDLTVNALFGGGATLTVNIPPDTSIDLLGPAAPVPVPAVTPMALWVTAILLAGLGFYMVHRNACGLPS